MIGESNTGRHFNLSLAGTEAVEQFTLEVSDAGGRIIYRTTVVGGSEIPRRFDLERQLTPGAYLIRLSRPGRGSAVKILLVGR